MDSELNNALVVSISRKERKERKVVEKYANYLLYCRVYNLHPVGEIISISLCMFFAVFASFAAKHIIQLPNLG